MKFSIKIINAEIAKYGVELVKGAGYFYFASLDGRCVAEVANPASIYVYAFNQMPADRWRAAVNSSLRDAGLLEAESV